MRQMRPLVPIWSRGRDLSIADAEARRLGAWRESLKLSMYRATTCAGTNRKIRCMNHRASEAIGHPAIAVL